MLEVVLGARSRVAVMRELLRRGARGASFQLLQEVTGVAAGTLTPCLVQLERLGVIVASRDAKAHSYRAAECHPLGPTLASLFEAEARLINGVAAFLVERAPPGDVQYVGWAYPAAGRAHPAAAIVLLVIADDAKGIEATFRQRVESHPFLTLQVATPAQLAARDPDLRRLFDQAVDVYASEQPVAPA